MRLKCGETIEISFILRPHQCTVDFTINRLGECIFTQCLYMICFGWDFGKIYKKYYHFGLCIFEKILCNPKKRRYLQFLLSSQSMPMSDIRININISQHCDDNDFALANAPIDPGPHDVAANTFACCILFTTTSLTLIEFSLWFYLFDWIL